MSSIIVELPAALRALAEGRDRLELSGKTVGEVLSALHTQYPLVGQRVLTRGGRLREHVNVFLDEHDIRHIEGLSTAIAGYSSLLVVPSVAGG